MTDTTFTALIDGLKAGQIVPYLGAYALDGAVNTQTGEPIPADSDSLILAMNNGQPMSPKLMYEFPRAAMNQELKRGRSFLSKFLTQLYGETEWTTPVLYDWLAGLNLPYLIDINRDTLLQQNYAQRDHMLIVGISRTGGTDYRFRLFVYRVGAGYEEVTLENAPAGLPILFKPMGTPKPDPTYIASDADYVDYITELMGGFAIPDFLKTYRKEKQYLLLGMRLTRDTERMVLSDIIYAAAQPITGWALIPDATEKEVRFCKRIGIEVIDAGVPELLSAAGVESALETV
ncbi:SIR2 family protein [Thioflexithrix psekupsensis]|uniref:SIR2 family protein n=1 Tax=Thioflexithrix psekupsensis TaxID=1570016 RepID=A0A251X5W4_9GAMM|nr:SIR2 family protein [Thioflexithrix psekupsensis]OUD13136.1 SIR2 family protein [Thioflexithrix psekupsensis]